MSVTYDLNKEARFGDQLISYLHARWIAYRYGFSFLYKPFLHSENFALHGIDELWTEEKENQFDYIIRHHQKENFSLKSEGSLLYLIPFFSDLQDDLQYCPDWVPFSIDWKDKGFRNLLQSLFRPAKNIPLISPPNHYLSVALHIRRGGGYDEANPFLLWPLRFLPDSYYIECLRRVYTLFPGQKIYAYIFTDEQEPKKIADTLKNALADLPITFDYREKGNHYTANVVEDFYSMMNFDCLIRSASNFTLLHSVIVDYKLIMSPKHFVWIVNEDLSVENFIDEIDCQFSSGI